MKRQILLTTAITATCLSSFAATAVFPINPKPWETPSQDLEVVPLNHLNETALQEIMEGKHPLLAVEFAAQTVLPISFYLSGDLANSIEKMGSVEIKQTFYARCVGEELVLSSDLTDWKPFLDFITGNATVALKIQDGRPSILVGSEINRRP